MRLLVISGTVVVFLSVFFALFAAGSAISLSCEPDAPAGKTVCKFGVGAASAAGLLLAGLFVVIGAASAFVMMSAVTAKHSLRAGAIRSLPSRRVIR